MGKHSITIELNDLEESLVVWLTAYNGSTSPSNTLKELLKSKISEEISKNRKDIIEYRDDILKHNLNN